MGLNIVKGDIRDLPFKDDSLSFVYSVNTLCQCHQIFQIFLYVHIIEQLEAYILPTT